MKPFNLTLRLSAALCLLAAVLFVVGWQGVRHLRQLDAKLRTVVYDRWVQQQLSHQAYRMAFENSQITLLAFLLDDPDDLQPLLRHRAANSWRIGELFSAIEPGLNRAEEKNRFAAVKAARGNYYTSYQQTMALLADHKREEAGKMIVNVVRPQLAAYQDVWDDFDEYEADEISHDMQQSRVSVADHQRNFLLLIALAGLFAGGLALVMAWQVRRQMALRHCAEESLRQLRDTVELRVAARTAQLAKANASLMKTHALLNTLLENTTDHIYFKDLQSRFVHSSRALLNSFQLACPDELKDRTDFDFYSEERAHFTLAVEQEIIRAGQPVLNMEEKEIHRDGRVGWVLTSKMPWRDAAGQIIGTMGISRDITERKLAEDALRQSEERFRSMFTAAVTGIAISTPDGYFLEVNAAYCQMLGYTEDELRKRNFASLTHPDDLHLNLKLRDEVLAGVRDSFVMEKRYLKKNGDIVWTRHSVSAVRATGGEITRLIVVVEDTTERKRAEETLRKQQTELQVLFDLMPAMLGFKDTKNNFLRVNQTLADAAGKTIAEIEGKPATEIFPRDAAKYYADDLEVIQSRTAKLGIVEKLQSPDGKDICVQTDKVPVSDQDGNVTGIVVMVQDITERKRTEERLLRLNWLHTVLSKVGEAIVRVRDRQELYDTVCRIVMQDGKLRLVFIAEADAEKKLARPAASCGEGLESLLAPTSTIPLDGGPLSQGTVGTALRTGVPDFCNDIAGEERMKPWHETAQRQGLRANASFPFHLRGETAGVLVLYAGEPGYFLDDEMRLLVSVASDISLALEALEKEQWRQQAEQKIQQLNAELELRVQQRTAQLEAANKELEAFSYTVSHDLRAPLRAVNGFAGIVLEKCGPQMPPDARRHLQRVCDGAKRMGELIDDLLAFSKLSRQAMSRRVVDSDQLVKTVLDEIQPEREGRRIEIQVGELPACQGDPALLKQVWANLISNAIKYTRGREPAAVQIGCERKNDENIFFVRDNGAGFDMQYAHKLFGVFQRLHRADEFEGTGVGLAIVQRIVNRHGGRVWAEAEVGKGATFYFTQNGVAQVMSETKPHELEIRPAGRL